MLSEKQIFEIREHLEKAQNPLFFFDNDNDGLTSFLLLRRFINRGKGIAIKSFPELNENYYKRVLELKPDSIFILDKPVVSEEFLKKIEQDNLPVIWIDHHQVDKPKNKYINYYNPYLVDKKNEPVSYLSYKITNQKKDIWLAVIGCISDCYMPDFYSEFYKKYPEMCGKNPKSAFDILYKCKIGKIARILDFSLKDSTTNVVNMFRFMIKIKEPLDIFEENSKTRHILNHYNEINSKYEKLIEKARKQTKNKLIYFQYSGQFSLSADLSNQLSYEFPDKIIAVVYINTDVANISLRGKNVLEITLKAIKKIEGASGGGHKNATGINLNVDNLSDFKKNIEKLVKNN